MPVKTSTHRFETRFTQELMIQVGEKAAVRGLRIWERTGLPEPKSYNYGDFSVSVPLNEHGISFVFRAKSRNPFLHDIYEGSLAKHDDLLQPLYRRMLDDGSCFEVRPGIRRIQAKKEEQDILAKSLKKSGLKIRDREDGVFGLLPGDKRELVVANALAVKRSRKDAGGNIELTRQSRIFGPLSDYVGDAFKSASSVRIQDALQVCKEIAQKQDGDAGKILYGIWAQRPAQGDRRAEPALIISS